MDRKISDLESILEPISVLFGRARETDNLDVPSPHNMTFSKDNTITLVWKLTDLPLLESASRFEKIKTLAMSEFSVREYPDEGIAIFTGQITWHGDYPEVYFRVIMPIEVTKCPNLTGLR